MFNCYFFEQLEIFSLFSLFINYKIFESVIQNNIHLGCSMSINNIAWTQTLNLLQTLKIFSLWKIVRGGLYLAWNNLDSDAIGWQGPNFIHF